jgi:hypothetical protein
LTRTGLVIITAITIGLAALASRSKTRLGRAAAALIAAALVTGFHSETLRMTLNWGQLEPLYLGLQ